jgi:CheY-like chemotaxis protein
VCAPETVDEAMRFQSCNEVSVVITDMRLADGHSGLEVLNAIRSKHPNVRSVLISAEVGPIENLRAYSAGFDFVIPKPFELSEVIGAVASLAQQKETVPA